MSKPRFLADQNLRGHIVHGVRKIEPLVEISTVVELGLSGAPDMELLAIADRDELIVVTHDIGTMQAAASDRWTRGETIKGLILAP